MSSQQIEYPEAPSVKDALIAPSSEVDDLDQAQPLSAGTTNTTSSSENAEYFDRDPTSAAQIPVVAETDRAAHPSGTGAGSSSPFGGKHGAKHDGMGKMAIDFVGTFANATLASQHSSSSGGGYGKKKQSKTTLLATGAKIAYDMYNKKTGKPSGAMAPNGAQPPHHHGQGHSQHGQPPHHHGQGHSQHGQSHHAANMYGQQHYQYDQQMPNMPPYGHNGPGGYQGPYGY